MIKKERLSFTIFLIMFGLIFIFNFCVAEYEIIKTNTYPDTFINDCGSSRNTSGNSNCIENKGKSVKEQGFETFILNGVVLMFIMLFISFMESIYLSIAIVGVVCIILIIIRCWKPILIISGIISASLLIKLLLWGLI